MGLSEMGGGMDINYLHVALTDYIMCTLVSYVVVHVLQFHYELLVIQSFTSSPNNEYSLCHSAAPVESEVWTECTFFIPAKTCYR